MTLRSTTPITSHPGLDEVRRARQAEIEGRLQAIQREMDRVARVQREPQVPGGIGGLDEHMRLMQQQIEILKKNRRSDWAAGLTNQPPPDYHVMDSVVARRVARPV